MAAIFSELPRFLNSEEPAFSGWDRPAAVMVLVAVWPHPAVLLIHRPDTLTYHAGQIACPGGSFDSRYDSTLWETAIRETQEEVGITVAEESRAGYLDPVYITVTGFTLVPFVAVVKTRPPVHPDSGEVASYQWVTLAELAQVRRMGRVMAWGVSYQMPEFPLAWGRLWGATARVMDQLLTKISVIRPNDKSPEGVPHADSPPV